MAMPKKGSRTLVVGGQLYRWSGLIAGERTRGKYGLGQNPNQVVIEHADKPAKKVKAQLSLDLIREEYYRKGKQLGKISDFPPFVVQQIILYAIDKGWVPSEGGGAMDLGNLDDVINFEELSFDEEFKS